MTNTPPRSVRVPDKLWKQAKVKAAKEHTTISRVIINALVAYTAKGEK